MQRITKKVFREFVQLVNNATLSFFTGVVPDAIPAAGSSPAFISYQNAGNSSRVTKISA